MTMCPIRDVHDFAPLRALIHQEVYRDTLGRFAIAKSRLRAAIPSRGSCHFSVSDCEHISDAFRRDGWRNVYAVALEDLLRADVAYRVDTSIAGIDAYNRQCAHFNCVLAAADMSSMVVCSTDDFFVTLGSESFVRSAVGRSPGEAFAAFAEYASASGGHGKLGPLLRSVLHGLSVVYPNLAVGEWVTIPE